MNARVWLYQLSIVSLVSDMFSDRIVAAGAAGKGWLCEYILKKEQSGLVRSAHLLSSQVVLMVAVALAGRVDSKVKSPCDESRIGCLRMVLLARLHSTDLGSPESCLVFSWHGFVVSGSLGPL